MHYCISIYCILLYSYWFKQSDVISLQLLKVLTIPPVQTRLQFLPWLRFSDWRSWAKRCRACKRRLRQRRLRCFRSKREAESSRSKTQAVLNLPPTEVLQLSLFSFPKTSSFVSSVPVLLSWLRWQLQLPRRLVGRRSLVVRASRARGDDLVVNITWLAGHFFLCGVSIGYILGF